jgi:predicted TIM-barrel fold metal-dependent hydrolase
MPFPANQKVIDLMLSIPVSEDNSEWYEAFKPLLRDPESRAMFKMPAQYMFKDIPKVGPVEDKVAWTLGHMDRHNITRAMIGFDERSEGAMTAYAQFRDRFFFDLPVNPNLGMDEVRRIREMKRKYNIDAVSVFPAGVNPQVPINDKRFYPIYTACVEENLPIFVCVGVPGPRVPMACQDVHLVDEVCWFFPELKFVMRHGAEPHVDMAVKLMLKYPNLFYSTSAFAPKHYPKEIINFANSRGSEKILYAGYFPMGLSLERIFRELAEVPFNDEVWPKFLYENAIRVLGAAA